MRSILQGLFAGFSYLFSLASVIGTAFLCYWMGGWLGSFYEYCYLGGYNVEDFSPDFGMSFVVACGLALSAGAGAARSLQSSTKQVIGAYVATLVLSFVAGFPFLSFLADQVKSPTIAWPQPGAYGWGMLIFLIIPTVIFCTLLVMLSAARPKSKFIQSTGRGAQADTHTVQVSATPPDF